MSIRDAIQRAVANDSFVTPDEFNSIYQAADNIFQLVDSDEGLARPLSEIRYARGECASRGENCQSNPAHEVQELINDWNSLSEARFVNETSKNDFFRGLNNRVRRGLENYFRIAFFNSSGAREISENIRDGRPIFEREQRVCRTHDIPNPFNIICTIFHGGCDGSDGFFHYASDCHNENLPTSLRGLLATRLPYFIPVNILQEGLQVFYSTQNNLRGPIFNYSEVSELMRLAQDASFRAGVRSQQLINERHATLNRDAESIQRQIIDYWTRFPRWGVVFELGNTMSAGMTLRFGENAGRDFRSLGFISGGYRGSIGDFLGGHHFAWMELGLNFLFDADPIQYNPRSSVVEIGRIRNSTSHGMITLAVDMMSNFSVPISQITPLIGVGYCVDRYCLLGRAGPTFNTSDGEVHGIFGLQFELRFPNASLHDRTVERYNRVVRDYLNSRPDIETAVNHDFRNALRVEMPPVAH